MYSYRLVQQHQKPGREVYEGLKSAARICPYCGHRDVETLDHYLPKALFPVYSVAPVNLVPSCRDCNSEKGDDLITEVEKQVLHPYYDRLPDDQWLFADVDETQPPSFRFRASSPPDWDPIHRARVAEHLNTFALYRLYGSQAGEEFSNIKLRLLNLHRDGGADQVHAHLADEFESRENNYKNSWQTAFYQACAASDWFCACRFNEEDS